MLTAAQLRAARALLGIDQQRLADMSGVSLPTIQRMEASQGNVRGVIDTLIKVVEALERTYAATPDPKWVVAAGDCAANCGVFAGSHACAGPVSGVIPVDLHIAGCPPTPTALLEGLIVLLARQA